MATIDILPFLDNFDIWPFYYYALIPVTILTMLKEYFEDRKRRRVDNFENSKVYDVVIPLGEAGDVFFQTEPNQLSISLNSLDSFQEGILSGRKQRGRQETAGKPDSREE